MVQKNEQFKFRSIALLTISTCTFNQHPVHCKQRWQKKIQTQCKMKATYNTEIMKKDKINPTRLTLMATRAFFLAKKFEYVKVKTRSSKFMTEKANDCAYARKLNKAMLFFRAKNTI